MHKLLITFLQNPDSQNSSIFHPQPPGPITIIGQHLPGTTVSTTTSNGHEESNIGHLL